MRSLSKIFLLPIGRYSAWISVISRTNLNLKNFFSSGRNTAAIVLWTKNISASFIKHSDLERRQRLNLTVLMIWERCFLGGGSDIVFIPSNWDTPEAGAKSVTAYPLFLNSPAARNVLNAPPPVTG